MDEDVDEDLLAAVADLAATPQLLVACGFEGALADPAADPDTARADQQCSEALNVLLALPGTTVAVLSGRPAESVAELMFLSGSKGGLRVVAPDELRALRDATLDGGEGTMVVVDVDPASLAAARDGDLVVAVGPADAAPEAYRVDDVDGVIAVLEELADQRR